MRTEAQKAATKRWRELHKERVREWNRRAGRTYRQRHSDRLLFHYAPSFYGVSKEQCKKRLAEQDSKCAICSEPFQGTPHIDHDHVTQSFRGLLCSNCNHLLGNSKDRIDILEAAITYLRAARK